MQVEARHLTPPFFEITCTEYLFTTSGSVNQYFKKFIAKFHEQTSRKWGNVRHTISTGKEKIVSH